jgi:ribosomal protein S18 acetylase RimI-like enzyme
MPTIRPATVADLDIVAGIAAAGFYDDPMMSWLLQDGDRRLGQLTLMFRGLAEDCVPDRGHVLLADDASVCLWRDPTFDHHADDDAPGDGDGDAVDAPSPFDADEQVRFGILRTAMHEAHPTEAHWYLNVVATRPDARSRGLGAAVLAPIIARADADGAPCYLESTNPRNRSLYRRHGFEDMGDIHLDDGVSMRQMWRPPQVAML